MGTPQTSLEPPSSAGAARIVPYAACTFISALLLFLIQPMIAKQLLPRFGGAAAVWTACLMFFQFMLLLGYLYADWTTRTLTFRAQGLLHSLLLGLGALA